MDTSVAQVFSERFATDNSYVDWAMKLDCRVALGFLQSFYGGWQEVVPVLDPPKLQGGLRVIAYSGGLQWRIFNCGNSVSFDEKQDVIEGAYGFFAGYLIHNADLENVCFMWWDDLAVMLSPADDGIDDTASLDLADKLFDILIRSLRLNNERAQMSAVHALGYLEHPLTKQTISSLVASGSWATDRVREALHQLLA